MLKNCDDCGKDYSDHALACVHCGAPNPKIEEDKEAQSSTTWIIICIILIILAVSGGLSKIRNFALDLFDKGIVAEVDTYPCENNNRINISVKQMFNESQYALSQNLKAVSVNVETRPKNDNSLSTCAAEFLLNNGQKINMLIDFKNENGNIMIYSKQDIEGDLNNLSDYIIKNKELI